MPGDNAELKAWCEQARKILGVVRGSSQVSAVSRKDLRHVRHGFEGTSELIVELKSTGVRQGEVQAYEKRYGALVEALQHSGGGDVTRAIGNRMAQLEKEVQVTLAEARKEAYAELKAPLEVTVTESSSQPTPSVTTMGKIAEAWVKNKIVPLGDVKTSIPKAPEKLGGSQVKDRLLLSQVVSATGDEVKLNAVPNAEGGVNTSLKVKATDGKTVALFKPRSTFEGSEKRAQCFKNDGAKEAREVACSAWNEFCGGIGDYPVTVPAKLGSKLGDLEGSLMAWRDGAQELAAYNWSEFEARFTGKDGEEQIKLFKEKPDTILVMKTKDSSDKSLFGDSIKVSSDGRNDSEGNKTVKISELTAKCEESLVIKAKEKAELVKDADVEAVQDLMALHVATLQMDAENSANVMFTKNEQGKMVPFAIDGGLSAPETVHAEDLKAPCWFDWPQADLPWTEKQKEKFADKKGEREGEVIKFDVKKAGEKLKEHMESSSAGALEEASVLRMMASTQTLKLAMDAGISPKMTWKLIQNTELPFLKASKKAKDKGTHVIDEFTGLMNVSIENFIEDMQGTPEWMPKLPTAADKLVEELKTNTVLLESHEVPVSIILREYQAADEALKAIGKAWSEETDTKARVLVGNLKKTIGGLPVLRKQMRPLADEVEERVATLMLTQKAPATATDLVEADPTKLAQLFECEVAEVKSVLASVEKCRAVPLVTKLTDVEVEFAPSFDSWSQRLDEAMRGTLDVTCRELENILKDFSPAARKHLQTLMEPFKNDMNRYKEMIVKEGKALHSELLKQAQAEGKFLEPEKVPISEEEKLVREGFAAIKDLIENTAGVARGQIDLLVAKYEQAGSNISDAAAQLEAIKNILRKKGRLPNDKKSVKDLTPEECQKRAHDMAAKDGTCSAQAKEVMVNGKKQAAFNGALKTVLDKSPALPIFLATLAETGTKVEFSTSAEDENMDKALYDETANLIKIDANLNVNVMVDMLLWEACNAENQNKFKQVTRDWNSKTPAEFGNAKAEVEADTSIKYALKLNQMMKEGALTEELGNITPNMTAQIKTIKEFDPDFFERPREEQGEKAEDYINFFKNSPQMKDAPRGSYTSLTTTEISVYDKVKSLGKDGKDLVGKLNAILKAAGYLVTSLPESLKEIRDKARDQWKNTDPAAKPKTYSAILKKLEEGLKREYTDDGRKKATFPEGYQFSDNMDTVATIQVIINNLEKQFLQTKPESTGDKVWEKEVEAKKEDWTRRLGTIEDMSILDKLMEASASTPSAEEFLTSEGV